MTTQTIAQGPVASQEAIKMLGTNGGGFFNANCAHPFENPTPLTQPAGDVFDLCDSRRAVRDAGQDDGFAGAWLGGVCGDVRAVVCRAWRRATGRSRSRIRCCRAWTSMVHDGAYGAGRQHGRQGSALRDCQLGAVCDGDDGRKLRRGELDARLLYAAGRDGAAGEHHAGRVGLRRRGRGHVRDADLRVV